MENTKIFYYHFNKLNAWSIINAVLVLLTVLCATCCKNLMFLPEVRLFLVVLGLSVLLWCYKHLLRHKLAVTDSQGISIDHCQKLLWKDIRSVEERQVQCGLKKMPVLVLIPKKDIQYHYNFLQRHNGDFTPFSIPLYNIVEKKDLQALKKIILSKWRKF